MRKMLIALLSSAAIGAGAVASATPAAAFAPIVVPLIIAAGIGGLGAGAVVANSSHTTYADRTVVAETPAPQPGGYYDSDVAPLPAPEPGCTVSRHWSGTHWHSVEICS